MVSACILIGVVQEQMNHLCLIHVYLLECVVQEQSAKLWWFVRVYLLEEQINHAFAVCIFIGVACAIAKHLIVVRDVYLLDWLVQKQINHVWVACRYLLELCKRKALICG